MNQSMKGIKMAKYNFEKTRNDYKSPPVLVQKALKTVGLQQFSLDTCCSEKNIPACNHFIDGEKDGLVEDWESMNWCNPPYDKCDKWVKKAYKEQQTRGNKTVMLIPARTETKYWHDFILNNPRVEIQWLRKGYKFINPENGEEMGVFKNALALVYFN